MNASPGLVVSLVLIIAALAPAGCRSPYYADRGAGVGALGGAGVGALVGNAVGDTAAGALLGAGVGALGGAAVGSAIDEAQAQNRAELAAVMGRQVAPGAATIEEVVAMSQQGVAPQLIQNYVRTSGMSRPLTAADVIFLHNSGVQTDVIQVMQSAPGLQTAAPIVAQAPPPVIVEEHYYDPWYGPHYHYYHGPRYRHCGPPGPRFSWGVSVAH
jgi:hypothetical protein